MKGRAALLFLKKKQQKNFFDFGSGALGAQRNITKVFCCFFTKKQFFP
jgi:hypothetical protein